MQMNSAGNVRIPRHIHARDLLAAASPVTGSRGHRLPNASSAEPRSDHHLRPRAEADQTSACGKEVSSRRYSTSSMCRCALDRRLRFETTAQHIPSAPHEFLNGRIASQTALCSGKIDKRADKLKEYCTIQRC